MKPKGRTRTESLVCLLVALATLMSPWDLWAQQTAGSESSGDDACLWVVPGKENLVFLGGSVHLLRKTDHPLPPAYAEAYEQSESVYFEVDLQEMQTPAFQRKSAELTRLPEGQTLSEIISEEVHSALRDFLTSRSLEAAAFEQMRPGMLAMVLSSVEAMRMGVQPQWGVEAKFDRQARKDGKPI
ncbi:MAG: TraB/GumN family protein, partial [Verrucomicrobiota bacterium]